MKNTLILLISYVLLHAGELKAQDTSKLSITVKPTISTSFSGPSEVGQDGHREGELGYGLAVIGNLSLDNHFTLHSGLDLKKKEIQLTFKRDNIEWGLVDRYSYERVTQVGVPIFLSYTSSFKALAIYGYLGPSFDVYLSGSYFDSFYGENDLSAYYDGLEFTFETGIGLRSSISDNVLLDASVSYSHPIVNPYDDESIEEGFYGINILRIGLGMVFHFR